MSVSVAGMQRWLTKWLIVAAISLLVTYSTCLNVCPGEGSTCSNDPKRRVCAKVLSDDGTPLRWGTDDFWQLTGQAGIQWDDEIRQNKGDSWCICMWVTAKLIEKVGCRNIHLRCDSTDVDYILRHYTDANLRTAKNCLQRKCTDAAALAENVTSYDVELRAPNSFEAIQKSATRRHTPQTIDARRRPSVMRKAPSSEKRVMPDR
eukprot:TRINITY_DN46112_c0_g1_i1.p1 TRINITY_DN46112_c0_g1~~TRINITY_DN46112_c0_g1_i1.p1  ORF type:complete len:205 (+),score=24.31 TRINITY_DN46112_c0_g1_i1:74-688(+)